MRKVLSVESVGFVRGGREILADVNLTVRAGQRWALIGPNGAGKSTLLSILGAISHPSSGTVDVLGYRLGKVDIRQLRQSIGHADPRHTVRSNLTARQVVLTGATGTTELMMRWQPDYETELRADLLIDTLGLRGFAHSEWQTMSQGERGRTLIARALLPNPPLLLLDEPTTGLDVAAREQFLSTVDQLHRTQPQLATVLVTHHLEELPKSTTHALLIKDGRVHAQGSADEVLTTSNVSACFDYPIEILRRAGRWSARAGAFDTPQ